MSEKDPEQSKDPSYGIKRIGADDFSVLIPLMENCFGMDVDIDYFRWKYTQNPAGSFIGFVAVHTDTDVVGGYYGVIPQVFELDGETRTVYQSCDTMTHSDHRRRGLFRRLATHCYEQLRTEGKLFVIGFGGGQSTPGFLKFGWKRVFDFRYYFKPALLCKLNLSRSQDRDNVEVLTAKDALEQGLNMGRSDINARARAVRSPEQIKWRLGNPSHQYPVLRLKDDPGSYIAYYTRGDKLMLFDLQLGTEASGKALFAFLYAQVVKEKSKGIIAFCQENGADAATLKSHGFISNPFSSGPLNERVPFIFYAPEPEMERYMSPDDWQVTSYDHDSF